MKDKVDNWVNNVIALSHIAITQPHAAYSAFTHGLVHKWSYLASPATNSWARFLPRTCPRLAQNLPRTCQELAKNLPRTCQDLVKTLPRMPRLCRPSSRQDLAKTLPKILSKMIPRYDDKILAKMLYYMKLID